MHNFIYNGKSLNDLGFSIKYKPFYQPAIRSVSFNNISGRNGAVIRDNGYYDNVTLTYGINNIPYLTHLPPQELAYSIIDWLSISDGQYKELRDSYNEGYFTKAICTNLSKVEVSLRRYLSADVEFSRIPFWYSDKGQLVQTFSDNGGNLHNPEKLSSNPEIRVYVSTINVPFYFGINGKYFRFENGVPTSYLTIDSENMSVMYGTTALDEYVSFDYFPTLAPGNNTIMIPSSVISSISIIPNWRRL